MTTEIIPIADLPLVTPGPGDFLLGVQLGDARRFPMVSTEGMLGFATRADLYADLAHDAQTLALVTNDATAAYNGTYRKVGASGTGSWVISADRVSVMEGQVAGMLGGTSVSDQQLKDWTSGEAYELTALTRDATSGLVTTATVKWPDGSAGTFTVVTVNTTYNAIDAYTITHTTASRKVTQTAVTRNSLGAVTVKPALTVGAA